MANHQLYSISNTEITRLTPEGIHSGIDITLQNVSSSGYIYVGGENVSDTSYGYRLLPNHAISFELPGKDSLHVIASAPGTQLAVLEIGLESQD
jgi:hypothetical protein